MAAKFTFIEEIDIAADTPAVLIVDDESAILNLLSDFLSGDFHCFTASSVETAVELLHEQEFSVVISDINMKGRSGLELIPIVAELSPHTVSMMISGEQNIDAAIGALKVGAMDYLRKPFDLQTVRNSLGRAVERYRENVMRQQSSSALHEQIDGQRDQLEYLKHRDPVTGLANHSYFSCSVEQSIKRSAELVCQTAVVFIALERVSELRQVLTSDAITALLSGVSSRWLELLPVEGLLARFDNDVFALMLPDVKSSADTVDLVRAMSDSLREPISADGKEFSLRLKAGIAMYPNDGSTADVLEHSAAIALAQAKRCGVNTFKFHEPEMNSHIERRLKLEDSLRAAVQNGELLNYYQPKVDVASGRIVGMEALVRWRSPKFGFVTPDEIVPICEELGLAEPLGIAVLEKACGDTKRLYDEGLELAVSVNVSGKQIANPWLPEIVDCALSATGLPKHLLQIEITESALIDNTTTAAVTLQKLRGMGISIAIDDFGTGYSSLNYLRRFPIDTLKIDRSFITDICSDPKSAEFVFAVVSLADKLGLRTVIEGIETAGQLTLMETTGCDEWQGYLCSRPMPIDHFRSLVLNYTNPTLETKRHLSQLTSRTGLTAFG